VDYYAVYCVDYYAPYCVGGGEGLYPYQTVELWYPVAGTIIAVIIVAMLNVGHSVMNSLKSVDYSK
jgi:hypothetical protein